MVKVGDMVKITDAWMGRDVYKNGDVLEVIGLSNYGSGGVWVRTEKPSGHGDYGCDRKIEEPYACLDIAEFVVVKDKEHSKGFGIGDKVIFTDDFIKSFIEYQQKLMVSDEEQLEFLNETRPYSNKDIAAANVGDKIDISVMAKYFRKG